MKALLALALLFLPSVSHAATPWEALTDKVMQEGTLLTSNFGLSKYLERHLGSRTVYLTIEIDTQTGEARRYSAVVENLSQTPDGKFEIDQNLFWFTPVGELAVAAHYRIGLHADRSIESRKEISYGVEPSPSELALWDSILADWAGAL
jgi:hypothetical protein